jgi:hypothetical protein
MDEFSWPNDVPKGAAGHFAAWLRVEKIVWYWLCYTFE